MSMFGHDLSVRLVFSAILIVALSRSAGAQTGKAPSLGEKYVPPVSHRVDLPLDDSWRFSKLNQERGPEARGYDDSGWQRVALPHTWNNLDGQDGGNDYYRGIGWYRRHVTPDRSLAGLKIFLQFDAASIVADVFINGILVGEHRGGFAAFRCDVTNYLRIGNDNVIAVRVSNAPVDDVPPLDADFTFFGGLYRHVHLIATERLAVSSLDYGSSGVYLKQTNVSARKADLEVMTVLANEYTFRKPIVLKTTVVDAGGSIVGRVETEKEVAPNAVSEVDQSLAIDSPHLWDGLADPYLYSVYVEVHDGGTVTDVVRQPLGLRFFSVDHDKGFLLNGHYLDLHGVNKHQDRLNKGWAISNSDMDEDFALIREIGATAVRLAHYQHPQHELDLADSLGLIVWAEIPLVDRITDSREFTRNAEQQLIELIRQNYNHPSIVFWGIANEITLQPGPNPDPLITRLAYVVRREDPTRLSTLASAADDTDPTNYHTDVVGFNKYYGWYSKTLAEFAPWADAIHRDLALATRKIAVSEYGAGASILFHSDTPKVMDHTEEYQSIFHETYWKAMMERPFLWGKFVWNMFDFAVDGRAEGDTKGRNDKGLVTYDRKTKKDAFYWYKANWSDEPVVYITGRRFNPRRKGIIDIKVYSNLDSVQLTLNGVSLGSMTSSDHIFMWKSVSLRQGANDVEAVGRKGETVVSDRAVWNH